MYFILFYCILSYYIGEGSINNNERSKYKDRDRQGGQKQSQIKVIKKGKNSHTWSKEKLDDFKYKSLLLNIIIPLFPSIAYCLLIRSGLDGAPFEIDTVSHSNCAIPQERNSKPFIIGQYIWNVIPTIVMILCAIIYYLILRFLYISKYELLQRQDTDNNQNNNNQYQYQYQYRLNRSKYRSIRNYFLALVSYPTLNLIISLILLLGNVIPSFNNETYWTWTFSISNLQGVLESLIFVYNNRATFCKCSSSGETSHTYSSSSFSKFQQNSEIKKRMQNSKANVNNNNNNSGEYVYKNPINSPSQEGPNYNEDFSYDQVKETLQEVFSIYGDKEKTYSESQIDLTLIGNSTVEK